MTPREFAAAMRGYNRRMEIEFKNQQALAAQQAAWIMSCWTKDPVNPRDLLEPKEEIPEFHSAEEFKQWMNQKKRERAEE